MDKILSIYLSTTVLEELPYVVGYCGEFQESITQWAGPHWIPGLSIFVFKNFLFWSVVSGTSWDFIDNDLARDCRHALDREATVHPVGTATRQHTHQASSAYTRVQHRVQANAITGPLTQPASGNGGNTGFVQGHGVPSAPASGASVSSLIQMEIDLFTRLANGLGLSQYD